MQIVTEPQTKAEIQRVDTLIKELDTLRSDATTLLDDDLKRSVTTSLDGLDKALHDERRRMQLRLGYLGLPLP